MDNIQQQDLLFIWKEQRFVQLDSLQGRWIVCNNGKSHVQVDSHSSEPGQCSGWLWDDNNGVNDGVDEPGDCEDAE